MAFEAVPKAALYAATLLAIGLAAVRWVVLPPVTTSWTHDAHRRLDRTLRKLAVSAAILAVVAIAGRAAGHTITVFGADGFSSESLALVTLESRWGDGWRAQAWASVALIAAALATSRGGRASWVVFAIAAFALASTIPRLGHAAGDLTRQLLHTLHVLASGAWLGGLGALIAVLLAVDPGHRAAVVGRFSPVALSGAALAAATGAIASIMYVRSVEHLNTPYGRALLVKLLLFAGVALCGRLNWRRVRAGLPPRLGLMATELSLAAAIVGVTGVLTELEQP